MLAKWILGHFPPHRVYVEPFGGAASVLLRKPRSYAEVYNDLDREVVNLFRVMQSAEMGERLVRELELTPFARDEFNLAYAPSTDPVERARRLVILAFMGFGSNGHNPAVRTGFRSNSNRSGSTPAKDWERYPERLRLLIERFRGVVVENRPAVTLLDVHDTPDTLFYIDPPYLAETRNAGHDYVHEMNDADHVELLAKCRDLVGAVVISGYPSYLYEVMLDDWKRVERPALADGARPRTEVLWLNARAVAGLAA